MAIFSFAALLLALLAAVKLSAVTVQWLETSVNVSAKWLPVVAFVLVFLVVVLMVNLIGKLIESTAEMAFLGWANRLFGIAFYLLIYLLIWSVVLFYLEKTGIIGVEAVAASTVYPILAPWAPAVLDWIAELIPVFRDVFQDIEQFLEKFSDRVPPVPRDSV